MSRNVNNEDGLVRMLEAIPDIPKGLWGIPYTAKCPYCDGTITACRSTYNGHLLVKCDKCEFMLME